MLAFDPAVRFYWEGTTPADWIEPDRRLYDCELVYVSRGRFLLTIDGMQHVMVAGSIAIVPPATPHESRVVPGERAVRRCVHFDWTRDRRARPAPLMVFRGQPFDARLVEPPPPAIAPLLPLVTHRAAQAGVLPALRFALRHIRRRDPLGDALLWPVLRRLLAEAQGEGRPAAPPGKTGRAVITLKAYLDTHYREPLDSRRCCAVAGLSRSHLCQAFHAAIGLPPGQYLAHVRLQHAARLLRASPLNVAEVGRAVGFENPNYFTRAFRQQFGVPPTRYPRLPE
jgi:AraC-like DNA-binding protein